MEQVVITTKEAYEKYINILYLNDKWCEFSLLNHANKKLIRKHLPALPKKIIGREDGGDLEENNVEWLEKSKDIIEYWGEEHRKFKGWLILVFTPKKWDKVKDKFPNDKKLLTEYDYRNFETLYW